MASPLRYFYDAKQREMAAQVWEIAGRKTEFYSTICAMNAPRFTSPDARRVLHAKDWCTYWRQDGDAEDNAKVNTELGRAEDYFSGECIAEVEHFFVAAFMEVAIGPALTQVGVVGWETFDIALKKPVLAALKANALGEDVGAAFLGAFPNGLRGWFDSAVWNYGQAARAQSGIAFGAELIEGTSTSVAVTVAQATVALRDAVAFVKAALAEEPKPTPKQPKTDAPVASPPAGAKADDFMADYPINKAGMMLSKISMERYNTFHLWPLIWKYNSKIIGNNPNKIPPNVMLKIKKKDRFTADEIKWSEGQWRNWQTSKW